MSLFALIRQEIKKEKTEITVLEKKNKKLNILNNNIKK